jgi:hypothetical protein
MNSIFFNPYYAVYIIFQMAAAAAFFLFQSRIKIQYLKTAITSLFFRIQKNFYV